MTDQAPKPRRGCCFYGCIAGLVLLALTLAGLLVALHYVKKLVHQFTDTQPVELPALHMSQAEMTQVKQRFDAFQAAVRERRPAQPLTLTSDDINALIAGSAEPQPLKKKFYVRLEGSQVKGEVSLPLQDLGLKIFRGRYLNGSATFDLAFRNGALFVTAQNVLVKGKPVPEMYMQEIRKHNLAEGWLNDPSAVAVLQGLQDIQVKDGKLVLEPKDRQ